jgi:hypothetical protein
LDGSGATTFAAADEAWRLAADLIIKPDGGALIFTGSATLLLGARDQSAGSPARAIRALCLRRAEQRTGRRPRLVSEGPVRRSHRRGSGDAVEGARWLFLPFAVNVANRSRSGQDRRSACH